MREPAFPAFSLSTIYFKCYNAHMILNKFPTPEEFYKHYWGKKPFIVRNHIPLSVINQCVDGDVLAGLALEEDIRSRFITNNTNGKGWTCQHGPLHEDHFDHLSDKNWSLLVQNVEQYHTDTAKLLEYFQFSPRWLLDDIMVSFSTSGGSVGPHTDSYHTFLLQGIGKREWKISNQKINDDRYSDNPDMRILEHGFDGETFEVTAGDVIYMPPFFGHEGKTMETAMTFSIGFLGPKLSEILGDYAQFLEENDELNTRYLGEDIDINSSKFTIGSIPKNTIKDTIISALNTEHFSRWMASYFSNSTHEEIEEQEASHQQLSVDELESALRKGQTLSRQEHIKITITKTAQQSFYISVCGNTFHLLEQYKPLVDALNLNQDISFSIINDLNETDEALSLITQLYNQGVFLCDNQSE